MPPNVTGYDQSQDDPNWFRLNFDDGSEFHTQDPDGSVRKQVDDIVSKTGANAQSPEPVSDPTTGQVIPPVETPAGSGTLLPNLAADYGMGERPPAPAVAPSAAPAAPAQGGAPASGFTPEPTTPSVITIPGTPGQTTTDRDVSTTGLSKEGKASVGAAFDKANQSQAKADAEQVLASTAIHQHAYDTAVANQAALQGKVDAEEREKKTRDALVADELRRIQERNAQPIDPKAAFKQDGMGAYALLASIGTAISNIGTRAEGQQGEDVLKPINDIIDRSVKLQLAQKQADFEAGRLTLAAYQSQAQETTSHLYALANQLTLAQAKVADTEEEKMGIKSLAASLQAKRDVAEVTAAQATADHRTVSVKTQTKSGTPEQHILSVPGGGGDAAVDQKLINDTLARAYPGMKPEQQQEELGKFTEHYQKTAAMHENVGALEREVKKLPGNDLPGHGPIAGHLPNWAISNEGQAMRQKVKKLVIDYTHAEGARLNPSDIEMMQGMVEGAQDKRSLLRALHMLKGDLNADEHEIQQRFPQLYQTKKFLERRQGQGRAMASEGYAQQERAAVPRPGAEDDTESE